VRNQLRSDAASHPGEHSSCRSLHLETLRTRKLFFFLTVSDCVGLSENGLKCSYVHHHHRRLVLRRLSESLV
jgi:hypothetical protein